jgi:hydroxymethylpyrimidine pyrophosphatase-like HAD family hydrolase
MRYEALATDYDGTLAQNGNVERDTVEALRRARAANLRLIMVTGRHLDDLLIAFPNTPLFDVVVAENGALLYSPASGDQEVLAEPPPSELVTALRLRDVPISVGRSIIATVRPHECELTAAIEELGLAWHVILNKESVMALPSHVDKATGLVRALAGLGVAAARTVAIGDAQNDRTFLRMCGVAVAVANALPEVKATVHLVTAGARGAGVIEVIDRMLTDGLADLAV